jgi:hypothetical protein
MRNEQMRGYAQTKQKAQLTDIVTLDMSQWVEEQAATARMKFAEKGLETNGYTTRLINDSDIYRLDQLGIGRKLIHLTGGQDFKGFITFNNQGEHVAVTPASIHTSTFKLNQGIVLETPTFADHLDTDQQQQIVTSVISSAKNFADGHYRYMRWHMDGTKPELISFLQNEWGLTIDSMIGTPDSQFILYSIGNGALLKLANTEPKNSIFIPNSAPIGTTHHNHRVLTNG